MKAIALFILFFFLLCGIGCSDQIVESNNYRNPVDSVGFAVRPEQAKAFINLINQKFGNKLKTIDSSLGINGATYWRTVIIPHDDYAYVQYLYPAALKNLKAKTIFIIGVAHKAKLLNLQDKLIFDFYNYWNAPFGKIKISDIRDNLIGTLDIILCN